MSHLILVAICLVVAFVYAVFHPGLKNKDALRSRSPIKYFILRWFHPLVWLLLAASVYSGWDTVNGRALGLAGFGIYVIYLVAFVTRPKH